MTKANAPSENVVNAQTLVSNIQKLIQKMEKKIDDKAFRNVQREFCKLLTETTRALSTQNSFLEFSMEERNKHAYRPIHTNNNFIDTSKQQQQERREENWECDSVKVGVEDKHVSRKLYRARSAASEQTYSRNGLTQSSHDARIQKGKNMFDDHNDTVLRNSLDGASPIFTPLQRPSTTATASLEQLQKENNLEHVRCHEEVQTEQTELHRPLAATTRITTTRTNSLLLESENNNNNNHERLQSTEERRSGAKTQIDTYKSNAPLHHKTRLLSTLMYSPSPQSCSTAITAVALESVLSTSASSLSPANSSTSSSLSPLMWPLSALKKLANHSAVWSVVLSAFFLNKKKISALAFTCLNMLLMLFNTSKVHLQEQQYEQTLEKPEELKQTRHLRTQTISSQQTRTTTTTTAAAIELSTILNKVIPIFVNDDGQFYNLAYRSNNNVNSTTYTPSSTSHIQSSPFVQTPKRKSKSALMLYKCYTGQAIYYALSEYVCSTLLSSSSPSSFFSSSCSSSSSAAAPLLSSSSSLLSSSELVDQQCETQLLSIISRLLSEACMMEQLSGLCLLHLIQACFSLIIHSATRKLENDAECVLNSIALHVVHRFMIYAEPLFDTNTELNWDTDTKKKYDDDTNIDKVFMDKYCCNNERRNNSDTLHCLTILTNYIRDVTDDEGFTSIDAHSGCNCERYNCNTEQEETPNKKYNIYKTAKLWQVNNNNNNNNKNSTLNTKINHFNRVAHLSFFRPHLNTNYTTVEDRVSDLAINVVDDEQGQLPAPLKDLLKLIRQCCKVGCVTCTGNVTRNHIAIKARQVGLRLLHVILDELPVCNCTEEHRCAHWLELVLYTTRYEILTCVICNLAIINPFSLFHCAIAIVESLLRKCHYYIARELHTLLAVFLFPLIASHYSSFQQKHRTLTMLHSLLAHAHVCVSYYINYDCNPNFDADGKYGGMLELMLNLVTEMMCTDYTTSASTPSANDADAVNNNNNNNNNNNKYNINNDVYYHTDADVRASTEKSITAVKDTNTHKRQPAGWRYHHKDQEEKNYNYAKAKKEMLNESNDLDIHVLSADQMQLLRGECVVIVHSLVSALHSWVVNDPHEYASCVRRDAITAHHHHHYNNNDNHCPNYTNININVKNENCENDYIKEDICVNASPSFLDEEEWAEMYLHDNFEYKNCDSNVDATFDDQDIDAHGDNKDKVSPLTHQTTTLPKLTSTNVKEVTELGFVNYHWKHIHYLLHNKRLAQEVAQLVNIGKWEEAQLLLSSVLMSFAASDLHESFCTANQECASQVSESYQIRCNKTYKEEEYEENEKQREQEQQKHEKEQKEEHEETAEEVYNTNSFTLLALFLYDYPGVDRNAISSIFDKINKSKDGHVKRLLQFYLRLFKYTSVPIDIALRDTTCRFLSWDRPMFEAQVWMTIQSMFGEEYARQNAHSITAKDADTMAGVLLFLHSNLHNESARSVRMSCDDFIRDGNACLDIPFTEDEMRSMYVRTLQHKWELNQYGQTPHEVEEQRPLVKLSGLMLHKLAVKAQKEKEVQRMYMERERKTQMERCQQREESQQQEYEEANEKIVEDHTSSGVLTLECEKMPFDATILSLDLDNNEDDNDEEVRELVDKVESENHFSTNDEAKIGKNVIAKVKGNNEENSSDNSYSTSVSSDSSKDKESTDIVIKEKMLEQSASCNCVEEVQTYKRGQSNPCARQNSRVTTEEVKENNVCNHNVSDERSEVTEMTKQTTEVIAKTSERTTRVTTATNTTKATTQTRDQKLSNALTNNRKQFNNGNFYHNNNNHSLHANTKNVSLAKQYMYAWEGYLLDPAPPTYATSNNALKLKEAWHLEYVRVAHIHMNRLESIHTIYYHSQNLYRAQPYIVPYYAEHVRPMLHLTYPCIMTCLYIGLRVLENVPLLRQISSTFDLLHELADVFDISLDSLHNVMYDTIVQYLSDSQAYKLLPPSRSTLIPFLMNAVEIM